MLCNWETIVRSTVLGDDEKREHHAYRKTHGPVPSHCRIDTVCYSHGRIIGTEQKSCCICGLAMKVIIRVHYSYIKCSIGVMPVPVPLLHQNVVAILWILVTGCQINRYESILPV
jgi:hypothetical protein